MRIMHYELIATPIRKARPFRNGTIVGLTLVAHARSNSDKKPDTIVQIALAPKRLAFSPCVFGGPKDNGSIIRYKGILSFESLYRGFVGGGPLPCFANSPTYLRSAQFGWATFKSISG